MSSVVLDERLSAAALLVEPGSRVADVGCDHGKLSVFLAQSGRAAHVIAIDCREQPLARARQLVEKTGCGSLVECRLADGLSCILPGEIDTVVIAGMSGVTAAQILAAAPWVCRPGMRLVLVPASRAEDLRRFLAQSGFAVTRETAAVAAGRPYPVLAAAYTGRRFEPDELTCLLGALAREPGEAAEACRRKALRQLERRLAGETAGARYTDEERKALEKLRDEVKALCRT